MKVKAPGMWGGLPLPQGIFIPFDELGVIIRKIKQPIFDQDFLETSQFATVLIDNSRT